MQSLLIAQVVVAVLLTVSILLQNRGTGAGIAFGSDFGSYYAKRGIEKALFYAAIVFGVAFVILAGVNTFFFGR